MSHFRTFALWIAGLIVTIFVISWGSVLLSSNPVTSPLARLLPWPVACTTRGCISSTSWVDLYELQKKFSLSLGEQPATPALTLTTLVRQHLVDSATLSSPVTLADAANYRQEILHLSDEGQIKQLTNLSAEDYDKKITLPFLKQEALRQQLKVESVEELYTQLSKNRWIFILPKGLWWNFEKGVVSN